MAHNSQNDHSINEQVIEQSRIRLEEHCEITTKHRSFQESHEQTAVTRKHKKKKEKEKDLNDEERKAKQAPLMFFYTRAYISLSGHTIDFYGAKEDSFVLPQMRSMRQERDGKHYHITVINHIEVRRLTPGLIEEGVSNRNKHLTALKCIYEKVIDQFGGPEQWETPIDLGLGRRISEDNAAVSYYRVIYWPFGQSMRKYFGLDFTNFHVTSGFFPYDVHEYKGPGTLMCLQEDQPCSKEQADLLVSVASHYRHDKEFLSKLYQTCQRNRYIHQLHEVQRWL
ncbi:hypothetical protein BCV72DRAFT_302191 [Rhizopus microsporus var. microsporus]|uniref:Swiss Army Knife 2H phosphoesterase domain-containing protein n=2 Tax=Rhizopus microsporus TaxID=58291 RepID=A0A2G4ST01_RHIZD|nr:uncharacterized protein RHIMIDRAFT_238949 [Rhizopus microsporus ATCC 52813]ORE10055.1 hypothetical protein BCV72DRAFT_302191 [Rhizopus microsporus var. microsporus]PHZ11516.1 hypothetical protein RHIMIDRAFT_238949 [Rhizopus microsporus ATCC 52813]